MTAANGLPLYPKGTDPGVRRIVMYDTLLARDEEICRRFLDGEKKEHIGRAFNLTKDGVTYVLRKHGVRNEKCYCGPKKTYTSDQKADMVALYEGGVALEVISDYFECSHKTVQKAVRAAGKALRYDNR